MINSEKIIEALVQSIHHVDTELQYHNSYTLLIAVLLSAQATDVRVNKITPILFSHGDSPEYIVSLGEDEIKNRIKSINYFNTKAKNIFNLSKILIEKYNSNVPSSREDLESLPGIGRKSANVILNCVFGHETIAVDTHIFRVANRLQIAPGKTPLEVEKGLEKITPKQYLKEIHSILVLHGRYVCKAKKPLCQNCTVQNFCPYFKTSIEIKK
jgi:endonuclease III